MGEATISLDGVALYSEERTPPFAASRLPYSALGANQHGRGASRIRTGEPVRNGPGNRLRRPRRAASPHAASPRKAASRGSSRWNPPATAPLPPGRLSAPQPMAPAQFCATTNGGTPSAINRRLATDRTGGRGNWRPGRATVEDGGGSPCSRHPDRFVTPRLALQPLPPRTRYRQRDARGRRRRRALLFVWWEDRVIRQCRTALACSPAWAMGGRSG